MTEVRRIESFSDVYAFLSNFYVHNGWSVEHHFQAAKTDDPEWKAMILAAPTPGLAKKLGRRAPLLPTWEEKKIDVMRTLLYVKFQDIALRRQLLATGNAKLIEGNTWGDKFWGEVNGGGMNWLGRLLMEVRLTYREMTNEQTVEQPHRA